MTASRLPIVLTVGMSAATITFVINRLLESADSLSRTNYRGDQTSLSEGFAVATALTGCSIARGDYAGATALTTTALVGAIDDFDNGRHDGPRKAKGLRGHWNALKNGHLSTGVLKVAAIGSAGALYAAKYRRTRGRNLFDFVLDTTIIAGSANIANLFDLRPGRALKTSAMCASLATIAHAEPRAYASLIGTIAAVVQTDLSGRTMLGDFGANPLGLQVGILASAPDSRAFRTVMALLTLGLIGASERVSFTELIRSTPALRYLDELGIPTENRE
ncbi:MAG: hypothetical protein Q4P71_09740 [Actinomycetaceae bacterium]|nr:hypothetical protein [Actinomycetaceae bacterium]